LSISGIFLFLILQTSFVLLVKHCWQEILLGTQGHSHEHKLIISKSCIIDVATKNRVFRNYFSIGKTILLVIDFLRFMTFLWELSIVTRKPSEVRHLALHFDIHDFLIIILFIFHFWIIFLFFFILVALTSFQSSTCPVVPDLFERLS
jgi:hypothetical protein